MMRKLLFIVVLLSAAVVRADTIKLEEDAAKAEADGNLRRSRALYLRAAKERETLLKKIGAQKTSDILDLEEDDEAESGEALKNRAALLSAAQLSEFQFRIGYDYLHGAQTNVAKKLFAQAEASTRKFLQLAEAAKDADQIAAAKTRLEELRTSSPGYRPPEAAATTDLVTLLKASKTLKDKGRLAEALKLAERAMELEFSERTIHAALAARHALPGQNETVAWIKRMAEDRRLSKNDRIAVWRLAGTYAHKRFRMDDVKDAIAALEKLGAKPDAAWLAVLAAYEDFGSFPRAEKEIVFPKALADLGVKAGGKTVRAEDYLDETEEDGGDMTKALQEAIDTKGVQTVVIGKLRQPWRIRQVKLRSNLCLQLEPGAVVLSEDQNRRIEKLDTDMFVVDEAKNVVIEGLGKKPEDCFIGKYATHAERRANGRRYYGGSGIGLLNAANVVIRNLKVSYNTCDGCAIRGTWGFCRNVWIDNVVFDGNYRQGLSVIDCDGLYVRKSVFTGTDGAEPTAGVDLEPVYHSQHISNVYFTDCRFADNLGGGFVVAAASIMPVSVCLRRCRFGPDPIGAFRTTARATVYVDAEHPAVGHLYLEDCVFEEGKGNQKGRPVCFFGCQLHDLTIVNSKPRSTGKGFCVTNSKWNPAWAHCDKYTYKPKLELK